MVYYFCFCDRLLGLPPALVPVRATLALTTLRAAMKMTATRAFAQKVKGHEYILKIVSLSALSLSLFVNFSSTFEVMYGPSCLLEPYPCANDKLLHSLFLKSSVCESVSIK